MERRSYVAALVVLAACVVSGLCSLDYFPSQDGPDHLYLGHLENHYFDEGARYAEFFDQGTPVSNLGFHLLFSAAEPLLGWRVAYRLALIVIALVWSGGVAAFMWSVHPERAWLGMLGFASAFSWYLFMGFFSFALSCGFTFAVAAFALTRGAWTWGTRIALFGMLAAQSAVHLFGAMTTGFFLLCLVLSGHAGPRRRELPLLALVSVPALVTLLLLKTHYHTDTVWLGFLDRLALAPRLFVAGPWWRSSTLTLLGVAGLASGLLRIARRRSTAADNAILASSLFMWLAALATPLHIASWEFFSPRFLGIAVVTGLALLPFERLTGALRYVGISIVLLFTGASLAWGVSFSRDVERRIQPALAGLEEPIARTGPRLPIVMEPFAGLADGFLNDAVAWSGVAVPYYAPLSNLGALYSVAEGGVPPYTFTYSGTQFPFVLSENGKRTFPPAFAPDDIRQPSMLNDPMTRAAFLTMAASLGTRYEDVILYGTASDIDDLLARGYQPDLQNDKLLIARFYGCDLVVAISAPREVRHPLVVQHGWDHIHAMPTTLVPDQIAGKRGTLRFPHSLCGKTWLRVWEDSDGDGVPSRAERTCGGAQDARIIATTTPKSPGMTCDLTPDGTPPNPN